MSATLQTKYFNQYKNIEKLMGLGLTWIDLGDPSPAPPLAAPSEKKCRLAQALNLSTALLAAPTKINLN